MVTLLVKRRFISSVASLTPDLPPDNVRPHEARLGGRAWRRSEMLGILSPWASSSMVEQLTLNQPVQGSSPWGLTSIATSEEGSSVSGWTPATGKCRNWQTSMI